MLPVSTVQVPRPSLFRGQSDFACQYIDIQMEMEYTQKELVRNCVLDLSLIPIHPSHPIPQALHQQVSRQLKSSPIAFLLPSQSISPIPCHTKSLSQSRKSSSRSKVTIQRRDAHRCTAIPMVPSKIRKLLEPTRRNARVQCNRSTSHYVVRVCRTERDFKERTRV